MYENNNFFTRFIFFLYLSIFNNNSKSVAQSHESIRNERLFVTSCVKSIRTFNVWATLYRTIYWLMLDYNRIHIVEHFRNSNFECSSSSFGGVWSLYIVHCTCIWNDIPTIFRTGNDIDIGSCVLNTEFIISMKIYFMRFSIFNLNVRRLSSVWFLEQRVLMSFDVLFHFTNSLFILFYFFTSNDLDVQLKHSGCYHCKFSVCLSKCWLENELFPRY